jgi:type IV secretory pathway component VirB8
MTASLHPHGNSTNHQEVFPAAEWEEFHEADRQAAKRIVLLLVGIFVIGIVLYSIVVATL